MTVDQFRRLALSLPETVEQSHMCHPDFRVGGKIFATLWEGQAHGMVKLAPADQKEFCRALPTVFQPVKGAWGKRGCTQVVLKAARKASLWPALVAAWKNTAPGRLVEDFKE
jgi:hypothetical protein